MTDAQKIEILNKIAKAWLSRTSYIDHLDDVMKRVAYMLEFANGNCGYSIYIDTHASS